MNEVFHRVAKHVSDKTGNASAFVAACSLILIWIITGPIFKFSDTWQLVINTGTTIITFLMVFLIQNTQNRDAKAMQLKLDELLAAMKGASNTFVNLEDLSDEELDMLHDHFRKMHDRAAKQKAKRQARSA